MTPDWTLSGHDIAAKCHSQQTSIGKRRGELVASGYVEATGETRPAPSGAQAMVWRVTPAGREAGR